MERPLLLNHILTSQHGKRIAVIENEFGEVNIDGSLVASHSSMAEDVVMVNKLRVSMLYRTRRYSENALGIG